MRGISALLVIVAACSGSKAGSREAAGTGEDTTIAAKAKDAPPPPPDEAAPAVAADAPAPAVPQPPVKVAAGWKMQTLPGFRVALPPGDVKADQRDSYENGTVVMASPDQKAWMIAMVNWSEGGVVGDAIAERAMHQALIEASGIPFKVLRTVDIDVQGNLPHKTWELATEDVSLIVTVIECGRRAIGVATMGRARPEAIQRQMVETFRCAPDAAKEADESPPPAQIAVPTRWQRDDQGQSIRGWSNGIDGGIWVTWTTEQAARGPEPIINSVGTAFGITGRAESAPPIGGHRAWEAKGGRGGISIIAVTRPCGERPVIAYYVGTDQKIGRALLAGMTCGE